MRFAHVVSSPEEPTETLSGFRITRETFPSKITQRGALPTVKRKIKSPELNHRLSTTHPKMWDSIESEMPQVWSENSDRGKHAKK